MKLVNVLEFLVLDNKRSPENMSWSILVAHRKENDYIQCVCSIILTDIYDWSLDQSLEKLYCIKTVDVLCYVQSDVTVNYDQHFSHASQYRISISTTTLNSKNTRSSIVYNNHLKTCNLLWFAMTFYWHHAQNTSNFEFTNGRLYSLHWSCNPRREWRVRLVGRLKCVWLTN